jgi:dephospho-CoA kinase
MKKQLYLIEGLSGTGKTSVAEELIKRGYNAIDADEIFGFFGDVTTGLPTEEVSKKEWLWDRSKFEDVVNKNTGVLFVSGGAMNQEDFANSFSKVFTLQVDDETLKERLKNRTNNDYGKQPHELARLLEWNKGVEIWSKKRGTVLIDAAKDLNKVVDEILSYVD